MKYTICIPQLAIVEAGLVGRISLEAAAVLDYLRDFYSCKNTRRVDLDGKRFVWLHRPRLIEELPMIFQRKAGTVPSPRTSQNRLTQLLGELRDLELIETRSARNRFHFRLTPFAERLCSSNRKPRDKQPAAPRRNPQESAAAYCQSGNKCEPATKNRDDLITENRGENAAHYMDETIPRKQTPPTVPQGRQCAVLDDDFHGTTPAIRESLISAKKEIGALFGRRRAWSKREENALREWARETGDKLPEEVALICRWFNDVKTMPVEREKDRPWLPQEVMRIVEEPGKYLDHASVHFGLNQIADFPAKKKELPEPDDAEFRRWQVQAYGAGGTVAWHGAGDYLRREFRDEQARSAAAGESPA